MKIKTLVTMALAVSNESKCPSHKVGTVIVKDGRVISTGYNGTRAGGINPDEHAINMKWAGFQRGMVRLYPEHEEEYSNWANIHVVHSEMNALLYAARAGQSVDGATLVTSLSPCSNCAKHMAAAGIKKVIYHTRYSKSPDGWEKVLEDQGIEVVHCGDVIDFNNYAVRVDRIKK
ncbi:dCMP deaminase [Aeromonas phage AS-zj]|uniref:dCMP deaminase n=2 Tax=Ceceduovirus TaxID=2842588 RepID=A0A223LEZ7_9CAUD|nr:dCMP deaminase [Aeromonas phage AS-zj]YP_009835019.1 dCMP deaminase [Aeromonas phage AS-sw]ASU00466.1 dCMP deaminase [Aeromonas phage AS-zj]ATI18367.1 dCMP deaminase [Aeromonas phage AS-sw]